MVRRTDSAKMQLSVMAYPSPCVRERHLRRTLFVLRKGAAVLLNMCRSHTELVPGAMGAIRVLLHCPDGGVNADACKVLRRLSRHRAGIVEACVCRRLVEFLEDDRPRLARLALDVLGNMSRGTEEETQAVIDAGALPALCRLLDHPDRTVRSDVCWVVSNIAAGSERQIQALCDAGLIGQVRRAGTFASNFATRRHAAWATENLCRGGSEEQIAFAVQEGAITQLCSLLDWGDDPDVTVTCLTALEAILDAGERRTGTTVGNRFADLVAEQPRAIELIQDPRAADQKTAQQSQRLMARFFGGDVDEPPEPDFEDFLDVALSQFEGFGDAALDCRLLEQEERGFGFDFAPPMVAAY